MLAWSFKVRIDCIKSVALQIQKENQMEDDDDEGRAT